MDLKIITTDDGSHSLFNETLDEIYHSKNGAIAESEHVFIKAGFDFITKVRTDLRILEVGFGTGLNVLLTALKSKSIGIKADYWTFEPFPVDPLIVGKLNYPSLLSPEANGLWEKIHESPWNVSSNIREDFQLNRYKKKVEQHQLPVNYFHLVYFDAFAPSIQGELWTQEVFYKIFNAMVDQGVLVTYSAKGEVRRNLIAAGFDVERIPGPVGKREMIRACKKANE